MAASFCGRPDLGDSQELLGLLRAQAGGERLCVQKRFSGSPSLLISICGPLVMQPSNLGVVCDFSLLSPGTQ